MAEQASPSRGWIVAFAGAGINVILGSLYAWSVMGREIGKTWGWAQMQCAMPFAVATASFALTMIFAGRVQDRMPPRYIAMTGGLLMGLGMIFSAFSQNPTIIMLAFGVLSGMGIGIGYAATTPAAIKWFPPARKGLISGIVVAGVGLAAVFMAPLTRYLLVALDPAPKVGQATALAKALPGNDAIGNTFLALGVITIVVVGLLALLMKNPPAGYVPPAVASNSKKPAPVARKDYDWREMMATPQFYAMWLLYVLSAAPGLMIIANAVQILSVKEQVFNPVLAPMIVAAFNTLGRISGGFVSDRIGRRQTLALAFVLQAANMALLSQYTTQPMLMVGLALTGLFYGSFFALMPAAAADFYGLKNMGVNYGLIFTGFGVAGVLGSLLGGRVKDIFGSYTVAYFVFVGMLAASAIIAFFLKSPKAPETVAAANKTPEMAGAK